MTISIQQHIEQSLVHQGMMQHLGVKLLTVDEGEVTLALPYSDKATQQQSGFHGGAIGALADIAGGYAALTVAPDDCEVTTVEYKINFLAAFSDGELHATGKVVKAGKRLIITTTEVTHVAADGKRSMCAVMQQTIAPVTRAIETQIQMYALKESMHTYIVSI